MTRMLSIAAFIIGAIIVVWMGSSFMGSNLLALIVTGLIGVVYIIGFMELMGFQRNTHSLDQAIRSTDGKVDDLPQWLGQLPANLYSSVRLRIQGEHIPLPGPMLTPYLVGLLVMLGLLGTFAGMVDTLKGAVSALEGTTELEAIRAGLAAPIKGLGLAFGTSVAGVSASAMLGFISTLSRRERVFTSQLLDNQISSIFQDFSLAYNRDQTFKAMQKQAESLPEVAQSLSAVSAQLEQFTQQISKQLIDNQEQLYRTLGDKHSEFTQSIDNSLQQSLKHSSGLLEEHLAQSSQRIEPLVIEMTDRANATMASTQELYSEMGNKHSELTASVDSSLQQSLSHSSKLLEEHLLQSTQRIEPLVAEMTRQVSDAMGNTQQQLADNITQEMGQLSKHLGETHQQVASSWEQGLEQHQHTAETLLERIHQSLDESQSTQAETSHAMVEQFVQATKEGQAQQQTQDQQRLQAWQQSLVSTVEKAQQHNQEQWAQQRDAAQTQLNDIGALLQASEELVKQRIDNESSWLSHCEERISTLTAQLKTQLGELHDEEVRRTEAITQQLQQLSDNTASHLQRLGEGLEAPMTHLIETTKEGQAQQQVQDQQRLQEWQQSLAAIVDNAQQHNQEQWAQQRDAAQAQLNDIGTLLQASEELVKQRIDNESNWLSRFEDRIQTLSAQLKTQLGELHDEEARRTEATTQQLQQLSDNTASHLQRLGEGLEAPMTRLIETASETPQAAAEVISKLREEISNTVERDNQLLEERQQIFEQLRHTSEALQQSSEQQQSSLQSLVGESSQTLQAIGEKFSEQINSESSRLAQTADHITSSAVELVSLGDAFGTAVEKFSLSNQNVSDMLTLIEDALQTNVKRSDEQMAYYIAQAREIIDHSLLSQQEAIEQLRQAGRASVAEV